MQLVQQVECDDRGQMSLQIYSCLNLKRSLDGINMHYSPFSKTQQAVLLARFTRHPCLAITRKDVVLIGTPFRDAHPTSVPKVIVAHNCYTNTQHAIALTEKVSFLLEPFPVFEEIDCSAGLLPKHTQKQQNAPSILMTRR